MGIAPDEVEIRGSWLMVNGRMTEDDVCHRIKAITENQLQHIGTTTGGWERLYRDKNDGRYWELTYSQSEMHGGGPMALFLISSAAIRTKYGVLVD